MAKKTGFGEGANAVFSEVGQATPPAAPEKPKPKPEPKQPRVARPAVKKSAPARPKSKQEQPKRRTVWIAVDHMIRLQKLKNDPAERERLHQQDKWATVVTFIDEALEEYLRKKGV